ncbi:histidine kinase dimerization/phosphoacceptor domain -containing protein [Maribacter sp. R77961]|uniref:tetratricopeptide repeat-containing sensor histidine kinase n=1 Tax=Maribacter sp. R77961 TaxID=3093871 RepID=UPI0037C718E9
MSKAKIFLFIISILLICPLGFAQTTKIDLELKSLHIAIKQANNTQNKANTLLDLCHYFAKIKAYNTDSLSHYSRKALKLVAEEKDLEKEQVQALAHLAFALSKNPKKIDSATYYLDHAKAITKRLDYKYGIVETSRVTAFMYLDKREYRKYMYNLEVAYENARLPKYNFPKHIILRHTMNLAESHLFLHGTRGRLPRLLLVEGIALVDGPKVSLEDKARLYYNTARLYDFQDDDDELDMRISYYEKAIECFDKDGNTVFGDPKFRLAKLYKQKGDYEKAIKAYKDVMAFQHKDYEGRCYYGLGVSYFELNDYDAALENFKKFIKNTAESPSNFELNIYDTYEEKIDLLLANSTLMPPNKNLGDAFIKLGKIYKDQNNVKDANSYFKRAEKFYADAIAKNDDPHYNESNYAKLTELHKLNDNHKKSLDYLKDYTTAYDSIYMKEKFYERENYVILKTNNEKDTELIILENNKKIEALNVANEKFLKWLFLILSVLVLVVLLLLFKRYRAKQKSLTIIKEKSEENTLLMQEIHHRVKNNLQIISSLLGAKITTHATDETIKTALQESQNKIKSMAIIHQNLYEGNQYTKVAVNTYIDELIVQIKSSFDDTYKAVVFQLDVPFKEIMMGLAVPLGLMLNELITNCYKYAFLNHDNQEKKISIRFHQLENTTKYRLIIQDNGKGLPADFNVDTLSSFGLQLVYGLTAQLDGEVTVTQDKGTTFTILLNEPTINTTH